MHSATKCWFNTKKIVQKAWSTTSNLKMSKYSRNNSSLTVIERKKANHRLTIMMSTQNCTRSLVVTTATKMSERSSRSTWASTLKINWHTVWTQRWHLVTDATTQWPTLSSDRPSKARRRKRLTKFTSDARMICQLMLKPTLEMLSWLERSETAPRISHLWMHKYNVQIFQSIY